MRTRSFTWWLFGTFWVAGCGFPDRVIVRPPDGSCVDTQTDPAHCGTCGHSCGPGGVCTGGVCDAISQIAAGTTHTCAVRATGRVVCWGINGEGQLGDTTTSTRLTPVLVTGLTNAVQVAAGLNFTCSRSMSGSASCWGAGAKGQLGNGSSNSSSVPVAVTLPGSASQLALGGSHACALVNGDVYCWGDNTQGQLGTGTAGGSRGTPTQVAGITGATSLGLGQSHTCVRAGDGRTLCFGEGAQGQLGNGAISASATPVVATNAMLTSLGSGTSARSCGITAANEGYCWGSNDGSALGAGSTRPSESTPQRVPSITAAQIGFGAMHTCGMSTDARVWCWGSNTSGALGLSVQNAPMPTMVTAVNAVRSLAVGLNHTCAIESATGHTLCWGRNVEGQLGDGTTDPRSAPTLVFGLP